MTTTTRKPTEAQTRRDAIAEANALRDNYRGNCSDPVASFGLWTAAAIYREWGLTGAADACAADAREIESLA